MGPDTEGYQSGARRGEVGLYCYSPDGEALPYEAFYLGLFTPRRVSLTSGRLADFAFFLSLFTEVPRRGVLRS